MPFIVSRENLRLVLYGFVSTDEDLGFLKNKSTVSSNKSGVRGGVPPLCTHETIVLKISSIKPTDCSEFCRSVIRGMNSGVLRKGCCCFV